MGYILTNTLKNQRNTHKFNAYSGSNRRRTNKTQKTPPQNRSVAGFVYALEW